VFEFLLINHPLDCPVCDKGGECPLQDFSYTFGRDESRMEFPRRVFDGDGVKADVDFGPTLMLNRNRCILCTRCVRFMRDVDGYWMCDIGRFEYHWIEGDDRVRNPMERAAHGSDVNAQQPVTWSEMLSKLRDSLGAAGTANPEGVRFLASAHASHEEFFLL